MQMTTVFSNPALDSMKAMALALLPQMKWRHHGIGVLQGYVCEDVQPEVRLHIWHGSLLKKGMDTSGDIHDHRFDMVSHVLCGMVGHQEVIPREDDFGTWNMMQLTHARAAKENAYHGPTAELPGTYSVGINNFAFSAGHSYRFPRGRFHRSPIVLPTEVTVTCVEKHNQSDDPARILYPMETPPVMAFGHDMQWGVIGPVIHAAYEALARK